jgi:hypothetical protein
MQTHLNINLSTLFMKHLLPLLLFLLTACQPKYYIITERDADGRILSMMEMTEYDRAVTKQLEKATLTYDSHPEFHLATLKKAAQHYAPHDAKTFAVYTHSHTVAPLLNSTGTNALAMWCTHEATYLAIVDKQDYTSKYYHTPNGFHLRDCQTGKTYPIVRLLGYPLGQTYWIEGVPGEWHCRVLVFPPLPEHCTTIDIINGGPSPTPVLGTNGWSLRQNMYQIKVATLQAQQHIATFKETVVVE